MKKVKCYQMFLLMMYFQYLLCSERKTEQSLVRFKFSVAMLLRIAVSLKDSSLNRKYKTNLLIMRFVADRQNRMYSGKPTGISLKRANSGLMWEICQRSISPNCRVLKLVMLSHGSKNKPHE